MNTEFYLLDDEKDKDGLVTLLTESRYSVLSNYGFNMGSCAVYLGDLNLEISIDDLHSKLAKQLDEEYLTTIIIVGDVSVAGRLENTSNVIVIGNVDCESFVDHGDGCFYAVNLIAKYFASWRCDGTDLIENLKTPLSFEWDSPIINNYLDETVVVVGGRAKHKECGATIIDEVDLPERLHPDLLLEFAEDVDSEDLHFELSDQADEIINWVENRCRNGKEVLL